MFNKAQIMIEGQKPNNSTSAAILPMQCYVQCGDNLELLKSQPNESVNMIYCDILYGTGRNFGDYQDLKPIRSEIESHYMPRLIEMKRVLKQNGVLVFQLDWRINHWMRILMDDVFGYENFRNEIIWKYRLGLKAKSKKFIQNHDVILVYAKSSIHTFNEQKEKIKPRKKWFQKFENGKAVHQKNIPPILVDEQLIGSVWIDIKMRGSKLLYPTEKPKELIERIVSAFTNEGDVVADYYLGSGTTAKVCQELNRKFIGCDLNPKSIEITKARLNGGQ